MKPCTAIVLLVLPMHAFAGECLDAAITDTAIEACAARELNRADAALDSAYAAALAQLDQMAADGDKGAAQAREQLVSAQQQWDDFRKADCDVTFFLNVDGALRIPATMQCMADHADRRREVLRHLFD